MDVRAFWLAPLLTAALAGCAADAPQSAPDDLDPTSAPMQHLLALPTQPSVTTDTLSGRFDFQENQFFVGFASRTAGIPGPEPHEHDITALMPASGAFWLNVEVAAQPGTGDIDAWLDSQGTIRNGWCDCPFGGRNTLTGYGIADGGPVSVWIQYDEVSSGPTDPGIAHQGVPYTMEVTVTALAGLLPPGVPFAVDLRTGDELAFANHTQPITVYGPDDAQVAVIQPGDGGFTLNGTRAGEHVFIGRLDGQPYEARLRSTTHGAELRALALVVAGDEENFPPGQGGDLSFTAPPSVIEVGACGFSGDFASHDVHFEVTTPLGEEWVAAAGTGPQPLGWGACRSNWPGSPDQIPGTWQVTMEEGAGQGVTILWWTTAFQR